MGFVFEASSGFWSAGHGASADDGNRVAREFVLGEEFANFELNELEKFRIVNHVDLVEEHHDVGNAHLASKENVLARLGHGAVGRAHHEDGAVHLGRARDHVLHIVCVAGAVDMSVVTVLGLVLHMRRCNGEDFCFVAASLGFRRLGNFVVRNVFRQTLGGHHARNRGRQCGFTMVHVADGSDVHVRLCA